MKVSLFCLPLEFLAETPKSAVRGDMGSYTNPLTKQLSVSLCTMLFMQEAWE